MTILTRKLNNTKGASNDGSFTLIIPKNWCELYNLKHGDSLQLLVDQLSQGSILIIPEEQQVQTKKKQIMDYTSYRSENALSRAILAAYLDGSQKIILQNVPRRGEESIRTRSLIERLTTKLDGCSYQQVGDQFKLKISSEVQSPRDQLRDLFSTSKFMFSDGINAFMKNSHINAQELIGRDDQADKLYFSIVRTLKMILQEPFKSVNADFAIVDVLDFRMVASNLENLCDETEALAEYILAHTDSLDDLINSLNRETRKRIMEVTSQLGSGLSDAFECFYTKNEQRAITLSNQKEKFQNLTHTISDMSLPQPLINVCDEITECIVDILELVTE